MKKLSAAVYFCLVFLVLQNPVNARQATESILPLNFPTISDIAIVERVPSSYLTNEQKKDYKRWTPTRWNLLLRRMKHPDLFDRVVAAYQKNGFGKAGNDVSSDEIRFVNDFIDDCYPRSMSKPWQNRKIDEFEKERLFREFVAIRKAEFASYSFKTPQRIAAITEAQLGDYDPAKKSFSVKSKQTSPFFRSNSDDSHVVYRSKKAIQKLTEIPMSPEKAKALVSRLKDRTVHVFDSHELYSLEPHRSRKSGVTAVIDKQALAVFVTGDYSKAIYTKVFKPISELAQSKDKTSGSKGSRKSYDAFVTEKMKRLCREMNLFNINGIPVMGNLPYSVLENGLERSAREAQLVLADRITLFEYPEILDPDKEINGLQKPRMFLRLLGPAVMGPYLDQGQNNWQGQNEFQIRKSKMTFFAAYTETLKKMALGPPLRLRYLRQAYVREYDFENKCFPVNFDSSTSDGIKLDFSNSKQKYLLKGYANVAPFRYPRKWAIGESKAERVAAMFAPGRRDGSTLYETTIFDVYSIDDVKGKKESKIPGGYMIRPYKVTLCRDKFCSQPIWNVPMAMPPQSMLEVGIQKIASKEPLYLWQPQTQVALLDKFKAEKVTRDDWVQAAIGVYYDDLEYFRSGQMLPHRIRGLKRRNFLSVLRNSSRDRVTTEFWNKENVPFFPLGFFKTENYGNVDSSSINVSEKSLDKLREWIRAKMEKETDELRMISTVTINREKGEAILKPGSTTKQNIQFSLENYADYGTLRNLGIPKDSKRYRTEIEGSKAYKFSVAYPAIEDKLVFSIDKSLLPELDSKKHRNEERYEGDLVVEVDGIDLFENERGKNAVLLVRPVRFEALDGSSINFTTQTPIETVSTVKFSIPVDIKKLSRNDLKRQQEQKRQAEVKRKQEEREAKEAARMARIKAEKEKYEREKQERIARQEREKEARRLREQEQEKKRQEQIAREQKEYEEQERIAMREAERVAEERQSQILEANRKANSLMAEGYASHDIDWSTGEPFLGAEPQNAPAEGKSSTGSWLSGVVSTLFCQCLLVGGLLFWRLRSGALVGDLAKITRMVEGIDKK